MKGLNLIIVGATGLVGQNFLEVLEKSCLPIDKLCCCASAKSQGKVIYFRGKQYHVEVLKEDLFAQMDLAFFTAGSDVSKIYIPIALKQGCTVIDNTSFFRLYEDVPLIVPEINFSAYKGQKLIANPNCSTIQSVLALHNVCSKYSFKKIYFTTYQSVSGSGIRGIQDLFNTRNQEKPEFYKYSISETCIPQVDEFLDNGYTKEEIKMVNETRKILNMKDLLINATCVRVPIIYGHGVSIIVEVEEEVDLKLIKQLMSQTKDVIVVNDPALPTTEKIRDQDYVYVGRIRKDLAGNGFNCYVTGNNLRRGAATNALNIILMLYEQKYL